MAQSLRESPPSLALHRSPLRSRAFRKSSSQKELGDFIGTERDPSNRKQRGKAILLASSTEDSPMHLPTLPPSIRIRFPAAALVSALGSVVLNLANTALGTGYAIELYAPT